MFASAARLLSSVLLASAIWAQAAGSISGRITSADSGAGLSGVSVVASRQATQGPPLMFHTLSTEGGYYSLAKVPAGRYTLCAQYKPESTRGSRRDFWQMSAGVDEEIAYLDPCDWQGGIETAIGGGPGTADLRLERGVNVTVLVDEPSGADSAAALQFVAMDAAGVIRAILSPLEPLAGVRRYRAALPKSGVYRLNVRAPGVTLTDPKNGVRYPSNFQISFETRTRSSIAAHFKFAGARLLSDTSQF